MLAPANPNVKYSSQCEKPYRIFGMNWSTFICRRTLMGPKSLSSALVTVVLVVVATGLGLGCVLLYQDWVSFTESKAYHDRQLETGVSPTVENYFPGRALAAQPVVSDFEVVSAEDASGMIDDDQLVIGVSIGKESRAYPIGMLEGPGREIINDELGGESIAATWCDMSFNPLVHSREVDGRTLTFHVSGMLWGRNLVMLDVETKSEWSDIIGRSMNGKMIGTKLETIPSIVTDWGNWKSSYPQTTALKASWMTDHYRGRGKSLDPSTVIGISAGETARAWPIEAIGLGRAINDEFMEKAVVLVLLPGSVGAAIYSRKIRDRVVTFEVRDGRLIDTQTGTEWDPISGNAKSPKFANQRLERLPGILAHSDVWRMFHPQTSVWHPEEGASDVPKSLND